MSLSSLLKEIMRVSTEHVWWLYVYQYCFQQIGGFSKLNDNNYQLCQWLKPYC